MVPSSRVQNPGTKFSGKPWVVGDEHPDVADTLYTMALCKDDLGDVEGAVVCLREAQSIYRKRGISHGTTEDAASLLASLEGGM